MQVLDVSGRPIGTVVRADSDAFVLGTRRSDLRLSMEAVFTVEKEVTLLCNAESVGRYLAWEG